MLVNRSLCWQRFTVPQLLAQALFAKECQEFPFLGQGFQSKMPAKLFLCLAVGLLCSALLMSSKASPSTPHSPVQAVHLLPLTHSVLQTCSPGGCW